MDQTVHPVLRGKDYRNPVHSWLRWRMDWMPLIALNVVFVTVTALLWVKFLRPRKSKLQCDARLREQFDIDPADVPEFKSTWRNAR
jgi:hypothetical protein